MSGAVQFCLVQCSAVQCSAVQCSLVQWSAVQCSVVQCSVEQYKVSPTVGPPCIPHVSPFIPGESTGWQWSKVEFSGVQ